MPRKDNSLIKNTNADKAAKDCEAKDIIYPALMTSNSFPLCFAFPVPPFWFQSLRNYASQQCFGYKTCFYGGILKVLTVAQGERVFNTGSVVGYGDGVARFHSSRIQTFRLDTEREGTGIFWPFPSVGTYAFLKACFVLPMSQTWDDLNDLVVYTTMG